MHIALIGYGKMGKMIEEVAVERNHEIVLRIDVNNQDDFTIENMSMADVAIEFTAPDCAYYNVRKCLDFDVPVVSGSTGWNEKLVEIKTYCERQGGSFLHTSNFSIGVNIFFKINQLLAKLMAGRPEYEVQIEEVHHTQKRDAPSGTAVSLAEQILQFINSKKEWVNVPAQRQDQLQIISRRVDPAPGTHSVRYISSIDDIEITHTAHNRNGFALGAVLAAEYIWDKKGVFTMEEVLSL